MAGAGLDHIVHAVRDLDAATALYKRLGFQVGARNRHPPAWGTQNHIIQLPGTFIELLAATETRGIAPHKPRCFSFGAFNRDFLTKDEGLSMLVLEGRQGDAEYFDLRGIGCFDPYYFERDGKRPNGDAVKVAFTLAFARDDKAADIGFFTCRQHHPENFWNSAFQRHPNGTRAVAAALIVASDPAQHRKFLTAFARSDDWEERAGRLLLKTSRGTIELVAPHEYSCRYGGRAPDVTESARLAAIRLLAEDLGTVRTILESQNVIHRSIADGIVVGPETALGAALIFETGRSSDR